MCSENCSSSISFPCSSPDRRLSPLELLRMGRSTARMRSASRQRPGQLRQEKSGPHVLEHEGDPFTSLSSYGAATELAAFLITYLNTRDIMM